jgi:AAA domain
MRFPRIQISSFRSHIDTTLDLQPLTVIRAPNAAGKSSIEKAFEITLAGRTDETASDGKGSINLIRAGHKKAHITITAEDGEDAPRLIECALNGTARTVLVSKPSDPQYTGGKEFNEWLEMNSQTLSCLCNNRYFVSLKPAEQKDILAAIILPKTHTWADWVMPAAHELKLSINWAKTPFEVIEEAYATAFKERTNVNRDLKNFVMPEGSTEGHDMYEAYSQKLRGRKTELDAAKAKKVVAESDARNASNTLMQAEQRLVQARGRLDREAALVTELDARMLAPKKLKELEALSKKAPEAAKLDALTAELTVSLRLKKEALAKLKELSANPTCPTCATPITEELMQAIGHPIIKEIDELNDRSKQAFDDRKALGDPADALKQVEAHHQAVKDQGAAKGRIRDEQAAVADAESKIDELKAASKVDTSALDAEIADLTGRVENGTKAVADARTAAELKERKDAATIKKAKLTEQQASLNKIVNYFEKEVKAELLAASIGPFTQTMNQVLAQWGYTCHISIEPYIFAITFKGDNDEDVDISLNHLSKSQKYRFSAAFQVALAITTGFRFVICDESDIYDTAGRTNLFKALRDAELDQVVVLGTDERTGVPAIEGAVFYRLVDTAAEGHIAHTVVHQLTA